MAVFPAGHILTSADFDTLFPTGVGAFTAYTPTWGSSGTQPTIGNGTIAGQYMKIGRLVVFSARMTAGSTSTYGTGTYSWTLPVSAAIGAGNVPSFYCSIVDASPATRYGRYGILASATTVIFQTEAGAAVTPTAPMTWATSDSITIAGWYEAAA